MLIRERMNNRYFLLSLIVLLGCGNIGFSQLVTDNAFIQGRFLEAAIAPNGSWGNTITVPAGYHTHSGGDVGWYTDPVTHTTAPANSMDFNYDGNHSGWVAGSPPGWYPAVYGPYYMPGTPFDGWSMQVNGIRSDAWYTNSGYWNATVGAVTGNLTGTVTGYAYTPANNCYLTPSMTTGTWTGSNMGLNISAETRIDTDASWAVVTVKFKNTTASTMTGLYYFVSADPDNDETDSLGQFTTDNHICYQDDAFHRVEVNALPADHSDGSTNNPSYISGLCTKDCRAKALIYTSWSSYPAESSTNTLDQVWNQTATWLGTSYYGLYQTTTYQDIAYGLIYNLGNLSAGDSLSLSFAWIFRDSSNVDSAFRDPQLVTQGTAFDSLDTVSQCTMTGCGVTGTTFVASILGGADKVWSQSHWTWSPSTGLSATTGTRVTVDFSAISGAITYTITGMQDTAHGMCGRPKTFLLTAVPCFSASNNSLICVNDTLQLIANDQDSIGTTYTWTGPGGFFSTLKRPKRWGMTMADTGWYYVTRTHGSSSVTDSTHVMLIPLPVIIPGSNAPICSGMPNVLNLTTTPDSAGETFSWVGPNGFTSTLQNPSIPGPPVSASGTYTITAVFRGCVNTGSIAVIVDTTPARPVVTNNSPLCSPQDATHGSTLLLTATDVTPAVVYSWSGPGGFTSFLQNPSYPIVPTAASGTYTVTVSITTDGITCSNSNTTTVTIDSTPYLPILGSNAPICSGLTLLLSATSSTGSAYSWTGPNGFTSALQNPSIAGATTAATGTYSVTATKIYPGITGGCTSDMATLNVVVDSTPVIPTASSNSPGPPSICERDTLFLTANDATAGVTYTWVGPNSFTSTDENPMITNVAAAATGQYTVTATLDSACSASTVITVSITPTPTLLATNNGPVCTGTNDTLFLQASSNPGATYSWAGPLVFLSNQASPFRTPVIMEMAGIYQVTAFLNGCSSLPVNDTVIVRQTPPPVWVKDTFYCQYSDVPRLQAFGDSVLWYPTRTPVNGTGSLTPPLFPSGRDTVMWFYVTQTVMNCESALDSFSVTIQPKPVVKVSPSVDICPHDSVLLVATDTDPDITYHWSPRIYLSDTASATVITRPITNVTYQVVTTNQYNCHDTAYTSVTVNASAFLYLGDSVTLYPGETYQLNPQTNCTSFTWTPAAGLDNPTIANPLASPQLSTKYIVHGMTSWGCVVTDSINIYVDPGTLLSLPNAFSPGSGPNNSFKIIKRGIATLNYFRIFDRWGNMVFSTSNIDEGWDGTYKGVPQPFGVYVYEVSAVTNTGANFEKHGNVTLLR